MSKIKQLAGQTLWYGGSSIAARFLNYMLTPFLTRILSKANYGLMSLIYTVIPIFNVLFTYGMETAFFRFTNSKEYKAKDIFDTTATSVFISTFLFGGVLLWFYKTLAVWAGVGDNSGLMLMSILIIMVDTLSVIPFAKLRLEGRPKKYAAIKIAGILINIFFTLFFLWFCPMMVAKDPGSIFSLFYDPAKNGVHYVVLANLLQAIVTLVLLYKELLQIKLHINKPLWKKIMIYSMPLIIAGLGGVINETFDRQMLNWLQPGTAIFKKEQVGIYSACYKLSILITLFIQAFRMGAEPFFFKESQGQNPQRTYARVLKFFVIVICTMFLVVSLYLPIWREFIAQKFWVGLSVVPILLLANMFLGIYLNLSIWYKLGHKTIVGAYITLAGVIITVAINFIFIPVYGYTACAWATFFCYGSMMVMSYIWGQKVYPIPYAWKKLCAYIVIVVAIYSIHYTFSLFVPQKIFTLLFATVLLFLFLAFVGRIEKNEFARLPVVGKYFGPAKNTDA